MKSRSRNADDMPSRQEIASVFHSDGTLEIRGDKDEQWLIATPPVTTEQ